MSIHSRRWKGKERQLDERDEGAGAAEGIVLPLDQVGDGIYDVAYTIPVKFGESAQQFSLQVDTGSSDLWVASTSCSTSSCKQTGGRLYDSTNSRPTQQNFYVGYLQGSVSGPIVWEHVSLGGYSINNQAMGAANNVQDEPLASDFSGILGLALPLNSVISLDIPPVTNNDADGAAWASNLFSITPVADAPAARFISLSLSRPGSNQVPSLLGIGRHPAALVPDPSKVQYAPIVSDKAGALFWKASVRAMTVYVGGVAMPIALGRSLTGAAFPSAVLDSGMPLILTTSTIANAVYGALGVTPASDGMYYVPCKTPLNMTVTLDDRPEISIHPLDLTAEPPSSGSNPDSCIGLIQAGDADLTNPTSSIGDMILGVPFMRNVYTVMAYTVPNADGSFPTYAADDQTDGGLSKVIRPRLGILPLTNATQALAEFNTVRVLNQPISPTTPAKPNPGTGSGSNTQTINVGGKKLSVGLVVLVGLLSFFALCCTLFAARWFFFRRRYRKAGAGAGALGDDTPGTIDRKTAYRLARRTSSGAFVPAILDAGLTEDELREMRYRAFLRKEKRGHSDATMDSDKTLRAEYVDGKLVDGYKDEFGYRGRTGDGEDSHEGAWDPRTALAWGGETLTAGGRRQQDVDGVGHIDDTPAGGESVGVEIPLVSNQERHTPSPPSSPQDQRFPHHRNYSEPEPVYGQHRNMPSVAMPLLDSDARRYTYTRDEEYSAHQILPQSPQLDPVPTPITIPHAINTNINNSSMPDIYPLDREGQDIESDDLGEFGAMNGVSMAGIGSASRRSHFGRIDSMTFNRESLMSISSASTVVPPTSGGVQSPGRGPHPGTTKVAPS